MVYRIYTNIGRGWAPALKPLNITVNISMVNIPISKYYESMLFVQVFNVIFMLFQIDRYVNSWYNVQHVWCICIT
jgi:hypothetical protein